MAISALLCGGIVCALGLFADPAASPPASDSATPAKGDGAAAKPDATLISVPSNTLGSGVPLWVQREQAEANARIARAEASYAEARAALARTEAQAAADRPDLYFGYGYGGYGGLVVYGPHQPGLARAIVNRPGPHPIVTRPPVNAAPRTEADDGLEDQHSGAQRIYADAARARIGETIENQQQAQRRFGENAAPRIHEPQRQRDGAVIGIRKAPKTGP